MIACTSPAGTARSIPFRISRPSSSRTCKFSISSMLIVSLSSRRKPGPIVAVDTEQGMPPIWELADAALEADGQKLLRLDGEFHRQFLQHLLAETVDDQRHRVLAERPRWRQ